MDVRRSTKVGLAVAVWALLATSGVRAETLVVYQAKDVTVGGQAARLLFPSPVEVSAGDRGALAGEALRALTTQRPALYAGTTLKVEGGHVEVTLGDAGAAAQDITVSELFHTLQGAGMDDVRIPRVHGGPLTVDDATLPVFLPVYPLWQVLPPKQVGAALVQVEAGDLRSAAATQRKLEAGDEKLEARLREIARTGPEPAKLAVIAYYEAAGVSGRSSVYLGLLKTREPVPVKLAVLKALAGSKSPRVLDAMAELADEDTDPMVKSAAARILMENGRTRYRTYVLLEKLQDDDIDVVLGAVRELADTGDSRVAATLAGLLAHSDERVRGAALDGLAKLGAFAVIGEALANAALPMPLRLAGAAHLVGSGQSALAVQGLRFQLQHGDPTLAATAAQKLGEVGATSAVDDLVAALKHSDAGVRHAAARALGALKAHRALPALAEATGQAADQEVVEPEIVRIISSMPLDQVITLTSSDVSVLRRLSLRSLAQFAQESDRVSPRIIDTLKSRLRDSDPEIRRAAVYSLARTGDAGVVRDLMALQNDADEVIREQVVVAAASAPGAEADELVTAKLGDPSDRVKLQAVIACRTRGLKSALQKLLWMVDYGRIEVKREVVRAVVALAEASDHGKLFDIYSRLLFDLDLDVKLQAIDGIRVIQDTRVVSQLGSLVRDPEEKVQLATIAALGSTGDPRAVEPVAGALMVGSKPVKMAALDALGVLRAEQAAKPLQEFLTHETDMDLRAKAEEILDVLP